MNSSDATKDVDRLVTDISTAQARIAQLEAALKAMVWVNVSPGELRCGLCGRNPLQGHAPDCIVGKSLKP